MKRLFAILALLAAACAAQGIAFTSTATTTQNLTGQGVVVVPIPGAQIYVCSGVYAGTACNAQTAVTVYQDSALTVPYANPLGADTQGNFSFWAAAGNYFYTVSGAGAMTASYQLTLPTNPEVVVGNSNSSGGGTNNTAAIQAILDTASSAGQLTMQVSGINLVSGLKIYSNTTINCTAGSGFYLANASTVPILQNAHPTTGAIQDSYITVNGCTFYGNDANQVHTQPNGAWSVGIGFFGVDHLTLTNDTLIKTKTFAIHVANWTHLVISHIDVEQTHTGTPANQDGVHINGPGSDGYISDIKGVTYDDQVALNADDGALGPYVADGPITDVVVDGVFPSNSLNAVRLLSATSLMDGIVVENIEGSVTDQPVTMTPDGMGNGNFGSITLRNVNVAITNPIVCGTSCSIIDAGGVFDALTINNVVDSKPTHNFPVVIFEGDYDAASTMLSGIHIFEAAGSTISGMTGIVSAGIPGNFQINDSTWFRDGSIGYKGDIFLTVEGTNGAIVPSVILSGIQVQGLQDVLYMSGGTINKLYLGGVTTQGINGFTVETAGSGTTITDLFANGYQSKNESFTTHVGAGSTIQTIEQTTNTLTAAPAFAVESGTVDAIGFNRDPRTGTIVNTGENAFQATANSVTNTFQISAFTGSTGATICDLCLSILPNGGANAAISMQSPILITGTHTVATLPAPATAGAGAIEVVTDATTTTIGNCVGGGSNVMIAVSNGTTWSCH